ncbi:MAG TPA: carbohydrate binding domain-containing protein, partial [Candidatus Goldiibacteriota bacterium]|nr:carbohydrate binding domain-containing protein [Candidatus Goldiibacteriota bacterium]
INANEYYNASVGFYSMLVMAGYYPKNFTSGPTATSTNTVPVGSTATNTPVVVGDCLFEDGEDNDPENFFGGFWYTYNDGTGAVVSPTAGGDYFMGSGGYNSSLYAPRFTGTVGPITAANNDYPSIGMGSQLNANAGAPPDGTGQVTNISSCDGIRFYAKGDGKSYHVKVPYTAADGTSMTGYNDYRYDFTAPTTWTLVDVAFTLFAQATGWGTAYPISTVLTNAKEFQWQTSFNATAAEGTTTANLWIDNIVVYGCTTCPTPAATSTVTPGGPTFTFTNTATHTYTASNTNTIPAGSTATFTPTATSNLPAGECLMENGEDGDNTNLFGGYWYTYQDGTGATIVPIPATEGGGDFTMTAGGYNGSAYAANFTGTVGP